MALRIIEVVSDSRQLDTIRAIARQKGGIDCWAMREEDDTRCAVRILVSSDCQQQVLDALQSALDATESWRIVLLPVEAAVPDPQKEREEQGQQAKSTEAPDTATREELYTQVEGGARISVTYLLLTALSTIVATIGLIEDSVAAVIGAMVIAPLLGPNMAFAFAAALGDHAQMWRAAMANAAGLALTLAISVATGLILPPNMESHELMARTQVGFGGIALALASGAAAVLSITSGLSSALVGVMVAVALLPPAATLGFMLGSGHATEAGGAAILLAVNLVCINLAAQVVFVAKRITPRTWLEKQKARQSVGTNLAVWATLLLLLAVLIYLRRYGPL